VQNTFLGRIDSMKAVIGVLLLAAAASALVINKDNVETVFKFENWQQEFNKHYTTAADYEHAFNNFVATLARIAHKNANPHTKATWGLTKFADLSQQEFKRLYLTATPAKAPHHHVHKIGKHALKHAPSSFDWRDKGAVTAVKDQAQCGSCWASSTTENVESMYFIRHGGAMPPVLGPQQLVDCDPQSQGCGGGWTYWAFQYLVNAGGQETEADYPYMAVNQPCKFDASKITVPVKNYSFAIPPCEQGPCSGQAALEGTLRASLATTGPFSICVNAATWNDYSGGVVTGAECAGDASTLDHCVQVVGYTDSYYLVRNSWNTNWGNAGYIYLERDSNTCGMADVVTFGVE